MPDFNLDMYEIRAKDWREYSAVSRTYPPSFSHEMRKVHGGIKPPELILELILAYGSKCKLILDPFAGVGSSLIACSLLNIQGIGIDINSNWKNVYEEVCYKNDILKQKFIVGDSQDVIKTLNNDTFDFLITDVPYFSMDKLKKTRGKFSKAGEPSKERLKSSLNTFNELPIPTYQEWIMLIKNVFLNVLPKLKHKSIIVIFIGNMYRNFEIIEDGKKKKVGKYLMLSSDIGELLVKLGYNQLNELVWVDTAKKLGIYGYPYIWIPSLIDQRILIFQKP